jgi:hypothetical protein
MGGQSVMTLSEACMSALEGNFVSHNYFDNKQSMHSYKGDLYYEDGANLTVGDGFDYLNREEWAKDGWYIKFPVEKVDQAKLKELHDHYGNRMITDDKSYEDCIIQV